MRGGGRFALGGSTEHRGIRVVFSARDLQRDGSRESRLPQPHGGFFFAKRGGICYTIHGYLYVQNATLFWSA